MTDPELPVTLQELHSRVLAGENAVIDAIGKLTARVAALEPPEGKNTGPAPRRWADRSTAEEWDVLVRWVDDLNRSYSLIEECQIHPCWPAHPGVVEELAALHHAWIIAAIDDARTGPHPAEPAEATTPARPARPSKGGTAYAVWHDRALWPFLERIRAGLYRIHMCKAEHQPEIASELAPATDRTMIPVLDDANG